ncbi:flagellin [Caenispirillum bisanense]|uniref:flagellin N-terminal helical domain-containing protein n=1 Tax=Caenispirillum bisanense TaxID=414052 RepID=UPI0031DAC06E
MERPVSMCMETTPMSSSILTNASAMTALRVLSQTNKNLSETQNRISTGLKVNNAKDNASFWSVATVMRSDVSAFKAIKDNLALAQASTSVARDGAQQISELIKEIKTKVTAAQEGSIDKAKLQADINAMLNQIQQITETANFNGVKLLQNDSNVKLVSSIGRTGASVDASYIEFNSQNLSLNGDGGLRDIAALSVLSRGDGLFKNKSDGTVKYTFDATAADGSAKHAGEVGENVTVNYVDAKGVARTVTIQLSQNISAYSNGGQGDDLAAVLSQNKQLAELFTFAGNGANLEAHATNRESPVTLTSISVGDGSLFGPGATPPTGIAADAQQDAGFEFVDAPLRLGEELKVAFSALGDGLGTITTETPFELSFRVVNGRSSGEVLESSGDGSAGKPFKITLALNADIVAYEYAKGADIAAEMAAAVSKLVSDNSSAAVEAAFIDVLSLGANVPGGPDANAGAAGFMTASVLGSRFNLGVTGTDTSITKVTVPQTDYDALLDTLEMALNKAVDAAAALGSAQFRVEIQSEFLTSMIDNLKLGIGTLVDADMNEESARLQALQVQQQLGIQSLSIANQAPQALLRLFQ